MFRCVTHPKPDTLEQWVYSPLECTSTDKSRDSASGLALPLYPTREVWEQCRRGQKTHVWNTLPPPAHPELAEDDGWMDGLHLSIQGSITDVCKT